jgi:hypothetical protein
MPSWQSWKGLMTRWFLPKYTCLRVTSTVALETSRSPRLVSPLGIILVFSSRALTSTRTACKFNILSSSSSSSVSPPIWCSPCWRQGLHYCILILLWDFWEYAIAGRPSSAEHTQVHAFVQGHVEYGVLSMLLTRQSFWCAYQPEDVTSLLPIKLAVKYAQLRESESMHTIALAHQNRNLSDFEKALRDYKHGMSCSICTSRCWLVIATQDLSSDPTIRSHLAALYDTLLQQNLLRIVEPYSIVEIDYVAKQVGRGRQDVEAKCVSDFLCE